MGAYKLEDAKRRMRILSKPALKEFWSKHPRAKSPLEDWWKTVFKADWASHAELKSTYLSADIYKDCYVFNIAGNNFRLIAKVNFMWRMVYVRSIMTHKEYDEGRWKDDC